MEEVWKNYKNRKLRIFFDDGNKVVFREGILKDFNSNCLFLEVNRKEEIIPLSRLVRIELYSD